MPYKPDAPFPKEKGNPLRSKDWNQLVNEVQRLDTAKVNSSGNANLQGPVGIGLSNNAIPKAPLHISGGNWDLSNTEGDLRIGNDTNRLKIGMAWGGGGAGDVRIRAQGGTNRLILGSGTDDVLSVQNGRVGIGTLTPNTSSALDIRGALFVGGHQAIDFENAYHTARSQDNFHYGYFEGRTLNNKLGFYLGMGDPGSHVDLRLESGDNLAITGGNVGIGTRRPGVPLDVNGDIRTNVALISDNPHGNRYAAFSHKNQGTSGGYALLQHSNGTTYLNAAENRTLHLRINNKDRLIISSNNISSSSNVRINGQLSVVNNILSSGDVRVSGRLFVTNVPFGDKRNMQWDSSSKLFYHDNSSRRHKNSIQTLKDNFSRILEAVPKTYTRPGNDRDWEIGYIAEEFHDLGLTNLVQYDENQNPDAINYRKICLYLLEILKEHKHLLEQHEIKLSSI